MAFINLTIIMLCISIMLSVAGITLSGNSIIEDAQNHNWAMVILDATTAPFAILKSAEVPTLIKLVVGLPLAALHAITLLALGGSALLNVIRRVV